MIITFYSYWTFSETRRILRLVKFHYIVLNACILSIFITEESVWLFFHSLISNAISLLKDAVHQFVTTTHSCVANCRNWMIFLSQGRSIFSRAQSRHVKLRIVGRVTAISIAHHASTSHWWIISLESRTCAFLPIILGVTLCRFHKQSWKALQHLLDLVTFDGTLGPVQLRCHFDQLFFFGFQLCQSILCLVIIIL